jgi:hypothetical protein
MGTKRYDGCTKTRRVKQTTLTLNAGSGETSETGSAWVTGPCGTPLFSEAEKQSGICRSCASGWTHPENYPVNDATAQSDRASS